ncbi:NADPH2:quinone reductase [Streptosporangium becharense]|uniref:NADPH2:quinone reductase n=1 Tax=Streptosporangium becharense TaxID=1816182 RepID=A0A7W9ILY2_9ACTN|nr:zinc-binding dehydrogenase [Streptosporangium becharense]MBB2910430.1 NADPH2:quinone reductase [Streptosporangium becharense]MBB5823173.1 NADPH2:quinone reductase [Streptosporangium becharense]
MRTVRYASYGDPDVLRIEEVPTPAPGPNQVLIRTEAIGVNFVETQRRRGQGPFPPALPASPNGDVVGTVEALGPEVTTVQVGDRVAATVMDNAYADQVVADATFLVPLPEKLDAAQASVLASPAQVALCVLRVGKLAPGETILVHSASGTIGHLTTQLAKILGAGKVLGTASTPAKREFALRYDTDVAIDYGSDEWADRVLEETGGRGADVIIDGVGGDTFLRGLDALAPWGRLVFYGAAQGMPSVPAMRLLGMKYVVGSAFYEWWRHEPDALRKGLNELIGYVADGRLRVAVHATLPLTEAAQAHRMIEDRAHTGRLLLVP